MSANFGVKALRSVVITGGIAVKSFILAVLALSLFLPSSGSAALKNPLVFHDSIDLYSYGNLHAERGSTFWKNVAYISAWPTDGAYNPLLLVDTSDPDNLTFMNRLGGNDAYWNQIIPVEDKLYAAAWGTMLKIYDISNRGQATFLGKYDRPDEPNPDPNTNGVLPNLKYFGWNIDVSNNRAYVTEGSELTRGWYIIDVANPTNPTLISKLEIPEGSAGIAVRGSYMYTGMNHHGSVPAANDFRFCVVNISNETAPQIVKQITGMPGGVGKILLRDNVAFVQSDGLISYDISDPTNPVELDRISCATGEMIFLGDYIFMATGGNGVVIANIANPSNMYVAAQPQTPSALKTNGVPINQFEESICGNGRYVYIGTATDAGQIKDLPPPYTDIPQMKLMALEVFDVDPDNAGPGKWRNYSLNEASWDTEYDGSELPTDSNPAWEILEDTGSVSTIESDPVTGSDILHINDNSSTKIKWWRNWDATNTRGTTVLVRARCASYSPVGSEIPNLTIEDGKYSEEFSILSDRIRANNANIEYSLDGTVWHTYRITTQGTTFRVYVDEAAAPVIVGTFSTTTARSRIIFGSGSTAATQNIYFDSLQCFSNGVFPPSSQTNNRTPSLSVAVSDIAGKGSLSGIDPSSAAVQWSTDGGNTWAYSKIWDCRYEGTALPAASSPAWTVAEGTESLASLDADGVFVNDNRTDAKLKWERNWGATPSIGTTVLTRVRCESVGGDTSLIGNIYIEDGAYSERFKITNTSIIAADSGVSYNLDATAWHTYRITTNNRFFYVYVDENPVPVMNGILTTSTSSNRVMFGSGSTAGTQSIHFDYLYYTTLGDYAPGEGGSGSQVTVTCTGEAGTDRGVITAQGIPFNQYSQTNNKVRFILKDMMGNTGISPAYNVRIAQNVGPRVLNVSCTPQSATLKAYGVIYIDVTFNTPVTITGALPTLELETGTIKQRAVYQLGNNTSTLRFLYQVQPGDTSPHLDYTSVNSLIVSGTLRDVDGSDADLRLPVPGEAGSLSANTNIVVDGVFPRVTGVTAFSDGAYKAGDNVDILVDFSEPVNVTVGAPTLELETGTTDRKANYISGTGTDRLTFRYIVQAGDVSADLNYKATNSLAPNGAGVRDVAGNNLVWALPALAAPNSLASNRNIVIDTTAPTGSAATPVGGLYSGSVSVALSSEAGCSIYYTTDGTEPTTGSSLYLLPIEISTDTVLRFFAVDAAGNEEAIKHQESYVVISADSSIAIAKAGNIGDEVRLGNKVLYYKNGMVGYIEESDRFAGIRIEGTISADEDYLVNLIGTLALSPAGEKYIALTDLISGDTSLLRALGANNRAVKSAGMDGLLVTVWGTVKAGSVTTNSFVITDGSDEEGIKVITIGSPGVSPDTYVTVTGAAGKEAGKRVIYQSQ